MRVMSESPRYPTILFVEDDDLVRGPVSRLLSRSCEQLIVREDGESGLEAVLTESYDFFVCDLCLPKVTGIELVQEARLRLRDVPILVVTGMLSEIDSSMLESCSARVLSKPFGVEELQNGMREASALVASSTPS